MKKLLFISALSLIIFQSLCYSSIKSVPQITSIVRYEILVYSCQLRIVTIDKENRTIEGLIPAVTPKKDSMVPFNIEVPVAAIRINPPWKPTPTMLKDPDERVMKPFKGGQAGNPLGVVAIYPLLKNPKFRYIRLHEAVEMPQRTLTMDDNGNLRGYRESNGCVAIQINELKKMVSRLTGLEEHEIDRLILSQKTRRLPVKHPATIIFLKE